MPEPLTDTPFDMAEIIENIVTEDDEPVDNLFSEKQQRLLVEPLYASWTPPPMEDNPNQRRIFLASSNVGIFSSPHQPPLVPDMFLSLDVEPHQNWYAKEHRSYFIWEFEKAPEVAVEVVSNRKGGELTEKSRRYARIDITYYVVYDPLKQLSDDVLVVFERGFGKRYRRRDNYRLPEVGLSLTLWQGAFEEHNDTWLRWCDAEGNLLLTGAELAAEANHRAREAEQRASTAEERASTAEQRAGRLAAKLRELGVDADDI